MSLKQQQAYCSLVTGYLQYCGGLRSPSWDVLVAGRGVEMGQLGAQVKVVNEGK